MQFVKNHKLLTFQVICVVLIKCFSLFPNWIEHFYVPFLYTPISNLLRFSFSVFPFSLGDILYFLLLLFIIVKIFLFLFTLIKKKYSKIFFLNSFINIIQFLLFIYIIFNLFWGINYQRLGIANQLNFTTHESSKVEIEQLLKLDIDNLNKIADSISNEEEFALINCKKNILNAYDSLHKKYSFIYYTNPSIKFSAYSNLLNFLGIQGYYNPFTGESQVNNTLPKFLIPNTTLHEMAHQIGYAKEDEANFVGFLAAFQSNNNYIKYSCYFDILLYAAGAYKQLDSTQNKIYMEGLHPLVKKHLVELKQFRKKYASSTETAFGWIYNKYLRANNLKKGIKNYDEVLKLLIQLNKNK